MTDFDDSLDWLYTVKECLGVLHESFPEGAGKHNYQFGPKLSEREILSLEQALGICLPADYRAFLQYIGNGGCGPNKGLSIGGPNSSQARRRKWNLQSYQELPDPFEPEEQTDVLSPEDAFYALYCPDYLMEPSDSTKPFPYTEALRKYDGFPREGVLELTSDKASVTVLIVSGEEYSYVWEISYDGVIPYEEAQRRDDGLLWPPLRTQRYTFKDWYLDWLQAMLNTARQRGIS